MINTTLFLNLGFALGIALLLFFVLGSKETLVRLKPASLLTLRGDQRQRRRGRKAVKLGVHHWEESFYRPIAFKRSQR